MKIYSPPTKRERAIVNDDSSYAPSLKKRANNDGIIPTQLNEKAIRGRVSRDIYSRNYAPLRELYSNEVKAGLEAKERYGADPKINVTLDENKGKLVIEGFDSLGITLEAFDESLTVLGNSSNHDRTKPGMFGMGFFSYTCLSDLITVHTHARNGERYGFTCRNGTDFDVIDEPDMDHFGTKVSLDFDPVHFAELEFFARRMAIFSRIHTTIKYITNKEKTSVTFGKDPIENLAAGINGFYNEYLPFDACITDSCILAHLEEDDIEIYLVYEKYSTIPFSQPSNFIAGIPITLELPFYDRRVSIIANIKDEGKYPPTPDRERFTDESTGKIHRRIIQILHNFLASTETPENFADYFTPKYAVHSIELINNTYGIEFNREEARLFRRLLFSPIETPSGEDELESLFDNLQEFTQPIVIVIDEFSSKKLNSIKDHVISNVPLRRGFKYKQVIFVKSSPETDQILYRFGAINGKTYLNEHTSKYTD